MISNLGGLAHLEENIVVYVYLKRQNNKGWFRVCVGGGV